MSTEAALHAAGALRTTTAIRERARQLLYRARRGESAWFVVDDACIETAAARVARVTRERYPSLKIPLHSRWRHFEAGGVDRRAQLHKLLGDASDAHAPARARACIDLAVVSVLLDAGAGPGWKYTESSTSQSFNRSEGLGVASFHAFTSGLFSSEMNQPLQADATRPFITAIFFRERSLPSTVVR